MEGGPPIPHCLVSCAELNSLLQGPDPTLRVLTILPSWRHWQQRIPGSVLVRRSRLRDRQTHRLVAAGLFEAWARSIGLHSDSRVVIVDHGYHGTWLWWAFRRYGHVQVQVLDGGITAWKQASLPLETGPWRPSPAHCGGTFKATPDDAFPIADAATVLSSASDPFMRLWDTRERDEWEGRTWVMGAAMPGRIPWARHLHWSLFRHNSRELRTFRTDAEIEQVIRDYGIDHSQTQIFYCQSGVRTTTAIFALYRRGWPSCLLVNYEGSWREWSALSSSPKLIERS